MNFPNINPTQTEAWKKLSQHFSEMENVKMQGLFSESTDRGLQFQVEWEDFYLDFSKNRITGKTMQLLFELAEETKLKEAISCQFSGEKINKTESRAVLHTALRDFKNMKPEVKETLQKMKHFSEEIIDGKWKGYTNKTITDVVNIGIGGSDLGPAMVTEALQYYKNHLNIHFLSNVDGDHVSEVLKNLNPETTLFIIVSKSFTTQETITNANTIRDWFLEKASKNAISKHFVAVSTNLEAIKNFGIASENIFPMWDWVGGRFSLWSSVGLSICCGVGFPNFQKLLKGAHKMDLHFSSSKFKNNIPVILGLLSVWYNNFFKSESEVILPYSQYLNKLVPYLQQAFMESNGKSIDRNGDSIIYETGNIIWGSTGTNAQHAFFQLLHQGTKLIPADFIVFTESLHGKTEHQSKLLANCFAQTEALLQGTKDETVENPFKIFEGNKPSNTLLIKKLTPETLGSLIATYEHKLFVQGVIWNIFSYDQWGVELSKKLAKNVLDTIENRNIAKVKNSSTQQLLKKII